MDKSLFTEYVCQECGSKYLIPPVAKALIEESGVKEIKCPSGHLTDIVEHIKN